MTVSDEGFGDDLRREMERSGIPVELTGPLGTQLIEAVYEAYEADAEKPEIARYDQRDPGDEDDLDRFIADKERKSPGFRRQVEEAAKKLLERRMEGSENHWPVWLQIEWDRDHLSPIIGPYLNITQARKDATAVRKAFRAANYPFKRVHIHLGRSPATMWGWVEDRTREQGDDF